MQLYPLLILFGITLLVSLVYSYADGRKANDRIKREDMERHLERMQRELAVRKGESVPDYYSGNVILQYPSAKDIATFLVTSDGRVCRFASIDSYPGYPIPDKEVTAMGKQWLLLAKPLLCNGMPVTSYTMPAQGVIRLYWLTESGWQWREEPFTPTLQPAWQRLLEAESAIAEVYAKNRTAFER